MALLLYHKKPPEGGILLITSDGTPDNHTHYSFKMTVLDTSIVALNSVRHQANAFQVLLCRRVVRHRSRC